MNKKSRSAKKPGASKSVKDLRPRAAKDRTSKGVRGGATSASGTGKVSTSEFQISKVSDKSSSS